MSTETENKQDEGGPARIASSELLSGVVKGRVKVTREVVIDIDTAWYPVESRTKEGIARIEKEGIAETPDYMDNWGASEDMEFEFLD